MAKARPPALIRKKDGAFTYTTTDLATIKYRVEHFQADAMLYVVDFRQGLHFKNLFDAGRRWGYANGGNDAHFLRLGAGQGWQADQDA